MPRMLVLDEHMIDRLLEERKRRGLDLYDEVWEGMYVMPPIARIDHQELVSDLDGIFNAVLKPAGLGKSYPGVNVSDRREDWEHNYRVPDVAVVLAQSRAVNLGTYFFNGPDFLVEVESPGDDTEEKVPFYSKIGVRELLIVHRDKRTLRLLRHDGEDLREVQPTELEGAAWLISAVLPLAFRQTTSKGILRTEVRRTDAQSGTWLF